MHNLLRHSMIGSFVAVALGATAASAQPVGLGTTQAGATAQLAAAIAKVVSERSGGLQMRLQQMAGAAQYIPLVNAGELEFGIANIVETAYAYEGKVIAEGRPNPDIRMVADLMPFLAGLLVQKDAPIKTIADLKGQAVPSGFSGNPLGRVIMDGYLATGGLSMADVKPVPVPGFPRMFDAFKQQQTVTSIVALGSANVQDFEASLNGVRYLPFPNTPESTAALKKFLPQGYFIEVKPEAGLGGIPVPTTLIAYDYVLFASAKAKDDVVAKVVAALHDNPADLKASGPLWRDFEPKRMGTEVGVPYHPGALAAYRQKGVSTGRQP